MGSCRYCMADPWISVEDRLPEDEAACLVTDGKGCSVSIFFEEFGWMDFDDYYSASAFGKGDVTHWMPLPEPPEEAKDE
jgi:hypothetical protein